MTHLDKKGGRMEHESGELTEHSLLMPTSIWRMDVIGQPERAKEERKHSIFSTRAKLCITVIPSTAHRQADKGGIRWGAPQPVVRELGR